MTEKQVLIIEDDPMVRMVIAETLADEGYQVLGTASADEAIDLLSGGTDVTLVFSDIDLPGSHNGIAFAIWAAAHRPELKVVLISGRVEPAPGVLPPGVDFMAKPVDFDALNEIAAAYC